MHASKSFVPGELPHLVQVVFCSSVGAGVCCSCPPVGDSETSPRDRRSQAGPAHLSPYGENGVT